MSRIACPTDNAMAESFMKTLKTEEVQGRPYRDLAHAKSDTGAIIEEIYNKHRHHSALAKKTARIARAVLVRGDRYRSPVPEVRPATV